LLNRIKERKNSLERTIGQFNSALKIKMDTNYEKEQLLHEIDVLIDEIERRKENLGQSLDEIRLAKKNFKELLNDINVNFHFFYF
jgi:ABC-type transporter Mla subunit MlaD